MIYVIFFAVNEMKEMISQHMEENCSFEMTKIGNSKISTNYVPLQMDEYQQNFNSYQTGHLHTRKEIIDRSKNSTSTSILPKDFFQKSRQHILHTLEYKNALTESAKEKVLKKKGNVVGVIGQAGVGKSTLTTNLLYRNVTDERLYKTDFVFFVKLRDFYDKTEMNLFQFLMGNAAYDSLEWMNNLAIRKGVLKLLSESESVCILLDGFDEAGIDVTYLKENPKIQFGSYGQNSPEHYILGLLNGGILPNAKKIITSRPELMLCLPEDYKPKFIVKIFGFKQQDIKQICLNNCDVKYASQVFSQIESQPDLISYCLIPINCILTVHCIYLILKRNMQKSLPKNITGVFVLTFFFFSKSKHMREILKEFDIKNFSDLEKISKLAWNGIKNKKIYFDENDLKKVGLYDRNISSFTVMLKQKNHENWVKIVENATKKCIYFSHLLLQEFFAAVFCLHFMNFTEFKTTFFDSNQFSWTTNQFEMIFKFMFGLPNSETFKILKENYPNISEPNPHIELLKDRAINIASTTLKKESWYHTPPLLISLCSWAYETQDLKFCENIAESFPKDLTFNLVDCLPCDILSLCYVIKARKTNLVLKIKSEYSFGLRNLQLFCKEMKSILKDSSNIVVIVLI